MKVEDTLFDLALQYVSKEKYERDWLVTAKETIDYRLAEITEGPGGVNE